jgi:outer membrane protein assembly factor BamB
MGFMRRWGGCDLERPGALHHRRRGGRGPRGPLSIGWQVSLDGAVYGQPLLVGSLVVAATEGDSIYGLDRSTGRVAWRAHVGTPVPVARA